MFIYGMLVGFFVGGIFGVLLTACIVAAHDEDERMDRMRKEVKHEEVNEHRG